MIADHVTRHPPQVPLTGVRLVRNPMFFHSKKAIKEFCLPQNSVRQALSDEIHWLFNQNVITRHCHF
ncbi:hypothetical protein [Nitrosomonas sp. PY1]|uniref:hypothetical protein n=1 Tax=Nitrosomonas sp. PY1 TaxID=1803906 RepID=UPI001FC8C153|nr:hypothetical protein [Nitrosomonas sp. PY1]